MGSLSLSPFNLRRQDDKPEDKSFEVAAKCVEQAFLFASENLDSIGLPLTPKLAELIRYVCHSQFVHIEFSCVHFSRS